MTARRRRDVFSEAAAAVMTREDAEYAVIAIPLDGASPLAALSPTEMAIALDIFSGRSNADIAKARGRSVRTIANQTRSVFQKLGVGSRSELVALFGTFGKS